MVFVYRMTKELLSSLPKIKEVLQNYLRSDVSIESTKKLLLNIENSKFEPLDKEVRYILASCRVALLWHIQNFDKKEVVLEKDQQVIDILKKKSECPMCVLGDILKILPK